MSERVAIVGVGESRAASERPEVSQNELANEAVRAALQSADLTIKDVDAVVLANAEILEGTFFTDQWLVEGCGSYLKSGMKVNSAGTTGHTGFTTAWSHVASGVFDTVLLVAYQKMDEPMVGGQGIRGGDVLFDAGGGSGAALISMWAGAWTLTREGVASEEFAARVRVKELECGSRNPNAHLRKPFTVEEIMNSPELMPPLRLFHCCPTTVGSAALVLACEKKAKKTTNKPVWVRDHVTVHGAMTPRMAPPLFLAAGSCDPLGPAWGWSLEKAATEIYKRNGITNPRKELDVIETYSPSVWQEILYYGSLHLCEKGEQEKFFDEGATRPDGEIPVEPSGGVPCTNPIAASGLLRVCEVALQIRGEAGEHQISNPNVNLGLTHAQGGDRYSVVTLLSKSL